MRPLCLELGPLLAAIAFSSATAIEAAAAAFVVAQGIVGCLIARISAGRSSGDVLSHWFLSSTVVCVSPWWRSRARCDAEWTAGRCWPGTYGAVGHQPPLAASVRTIMPRPLAPTVRLVRTGWQYWPYCIVAVGSRLRGATFASIPAHTTRRLCCSSADRRGCVRERCRSAGSSVRACPFGEDFQPFHPALPGDR